MLSISASVLDKSYVSCKVSSRPREEEELETGAAQQVRNIKGN